MLKKQSQQDPTEYWENGQNEKIEFDWTDILAFIIAFFQVLFPYVVGTVGSFLLVAFLLNLWMK
ncbi:hypothetical protein [Alkaliphilus sp. B6464]|uniref:hypothetical protein n=1 Tax=Alkaliphilus sp. B6464 TaxID=2731219 RepID=UPI001BAA519C|nr:hypothetical protein [Alkaliphilus sp. B6464]QUH20986.1 hypothetical protein HYG84_14600 [Alkaliphilus sp. B6464]